MPYPDTFELNEDWVECNYCGKGKLMYSEMTRCLVDNEKPGPELKKRVVKICIDCREKCRKDSSYEKYVTEKTFREKLGRLVVINDAAIAGGAPPESPPSDHRPAR